jgi:hypothetical protein
LRRRLVLVRNAASFDGRLYCGASADYGSVAELEPQWGAKIAKAIARWGCACRKPYPARSGGMVVFVEDAVEVIASSDVEVGNMVLVLVPDR